MTTAHTSDLPDFDTLAKLAQEDPTAFEAFRTKLLQDAVAAAPAHLRPQLEATVAQLNTARAGASSPLEAASLANAAMMDSFQDLNSQMKRASFALKDMANTAQNAVAKLAPDSGMTRTYIK